MTDEWTTIATVDQVGDDEPAVARFDGQEVAIYKVGDDYFATSNICTHGMVRLSDGYLDGFVIECPLHQGMFDIRDGKCAGGPVYLDLASYEVRVDDDRIEVRPRG